MPTYLERELKHFSTLVADESWKQDHQDAMGCLGLEHLLGLGVLVYDAMLGTEDLERRAALDNPSLWTAETSKECRAMKESWLELSDFLEKEIKRCEGKGYTVDHASEYRKRVAECRWLLAPASKAFNSPKIVKLRDAALDERAGTKKPRKRRRG